MDVGTVHSVFQVSLLNWDELCSWEELNIPILHIL